MTISILVVPSQVGFRAMTGGLLDLSAEAASAAEAVNALHEMIAGRIERGNSHRSRRSSASTPNPSSVTIGKPVIRRLGGGRGDIPRRAGNL